jgi:hypothetical protein
MEMQIFEKLEDTVIRMSASLRRESSQGGLGDYRSSRSKPLSSNSLRSRSRSSMCIWPDKTCALSGQSGQVQYFFIGTF